MFSCVHDASGSSVGLETWKCSSTAMLNWLAWTKYWHWMSCRTRRAFTSLCVCVCVANQCLCEGERRLHACILCLCAEVYVWWGTDASVHPFTHACMFLWKDKQAGRRTEKERISYNKKFCSLQLASTFCEHLRKSNFVGTASGSSVFCFPHL